MLVLKKLKSAPRKRRKASLDSDTSWSLEDDESLMSDRHTNVVSYDELFCMLMCISCWSLFIKIPIDN